jgi:hypothetical protein
VPNDPDTHTSRLFWGVEEGEGEIFGENSDPREIDSVKAGPLS